MREVGDALIVTGPPGSGKTTVARLIARQRERAAVVEADRFFHFIESGYVEPWRRESSGQNDVVMGIVAEATRGFAEGGYFAVVEGILIPGWYLEPTHVALDRAGLDVSLAILRVDLATALIRARGRSRDALRNDAAIEQLWSSFGDLGDLGQYAVDNQDRDASATASDVIDRLEHEALRLARRRRDD